ncbi:xylosidase [Acanthamoeba castellanii str. Neff]|uniref:beta-glucosidase n=1 Tax=Acanthamoeba castellanii (strain ATCC 30010 / Neff) TaxID=1257118 RepID=L8GXZ7_ACACF|nr:xylosidase [Acanthamoeba castellanii str. Neff]ELR17827.1 xylosidase [Acanthamoeba castellanii str. Neff]
MKTATVWALLLALVIAVAALTSGASAARNNARTAKRDAFVARLMASLTLKEKVGQMTQLDIGMLQEHDSRGNLLASLNKTALIYGIKNYGIGSYLNTPFTGSAPVWDRNGKPEIGWNVTQWIEFVNTVQETALQYGNSSVPIIYGLDSVHGANYVRGAVMFPHNIGLAAAWEPHLVYLGAKVTAKDTRTAGIPWAFTPVLGLGIQPLWPRFYETFGEDPYLISTYGRAAVEGYMGKTFSSGDLETVVWCRKPQRGDNDDEDYHTEESGWSTTVSVSLKHYLGYPNPISGKDRTEAWIPDRMLLQYFAPSFIAAVQAGAQNVMINSGSINGIPVHTSEQYLNHYLKESWGFEGFAVTDWNDIEKLVYFHHVAADNKEAIRMALLAGVDMSMVPSDYSFSDDLFALVQEDASIRAIVDKSTERILKIKYDLGLFTNPYASNLSNPNIATVGSKSDRLMSENVVRESLTLLRNQDNALPLSAVAQKILVVGPAADSLPNQCGGWSIHWGGAASPSDFDAYPDTSTIYQGIQSLAPSGSNVQLIAACDFDKCDSSNLREIEAIIAASVDVVVLAVGEAPESESEGDINDLTISPSQIELIKTVHGAIAKSGKKVKTVMVLVEARPRIIPEELINATSAVINAYLPGPYAGTPLAEVLFGKANPSGKLPFTYPRTTGDIHVPYWHWYSDVTTPLFPFGFGLSYTTFAYDNLRVSDTNLAPGKPVTISVRVTNSGKVPGREVVQLYVSDVYATVAPSVKLLKRYVKTRSLAPGQSYVATFTLATHDLAFYNREQQFVAEAGLFNIQVGTLTSSFTLTGKSLICPAI